ncbi:arsenic resistance protein, partial [Streptomyces sp. NPDC004976]
MAIAALVLFAVFLLLDGGVRIAVQRRRTGESGVRRPVGAFHWCARLASALGGLAWALQAWAARRPAGQKVSDAATTTMVPLMAATLLVVVA